MKLARSEVGQQRVVETGAPKSQTDQIVAKTKPIVITSDCFLRSDSNREYVCLINGQNAVVGAGKCKCYCECKCDFCVCECKCFCDCDCKCDCTTHPKSS